MNMSGGTNLKPDPNGNLFDRMRTGGLLGQTKPQPNGQQPSILKTIMSDPMSIFKNSTTNKPLGLRG